MVSTYKTPYPVRFFQSDRLQIHDDCKMSARHLPDNPGHNGKQLKDFDIVKTQSNEKKIACFLGYPCKKCIQQVPQFAKDSCTGANIQKGRVS